MNSSNKTLIILSPGFPANETDSTCLPFPQSFVKNLKQQYPLLNIIVLAFHYPFASGMYKWHDVAVCAFNGKDKGKIRRLLVWKAVRKEIKKIVQQHDVLGILNFWMGECALIARYAAKKYRVPSFTWLLGQDARKNNRYFPLIKPAPGGLVALSDFVAEELHRNYGIRPANTIPAGIDTKAFPATGPERYIDIMGAGSLIPLKQYDQFIHTVATLSRLRPGIKVVLCGDGPEKKSLQQLIDTYALNDHIELCGALDHEKVLTLMQVSKIFLHPSSYEGFSTVCGEALYAGAHVVTYCKPMNVDFRHLHIVDTAPAMAAEVLALLNTVSLNHDRVLTYPIADCCRKIMALYN